MGRHYIQTIDYTYNVRSWQKTISSPVFAETLHYQDAIDGATALYNGNISATEWGMPSAQSKKYCYSYDKLNRMTNAIYSPGQIYNECVGLYDKNGNIKSIYRSGYIHDPDTYEPMLDPIDNLDLNYQGNQLTSVHDGVPVDLDLANNDFMNGTTGNAYTYDACGNMNGDSNKGIAWIKYNSLNLPSKIQFMNGNKTEYFYDAAGMKREARYSYALTQMQIPLAETSTENTGYNLLSGSHTDYFGSYIYENDKISRILTPEGYIQTAGAVPMTNMGKWKYTYFLKDHLGNTRAQLACDSIGTFGSTAYTVAGTTDYYPFGMEISHSDGELTSGTNPYLYNGKEMDRMNGLNMYDYGARWRGGDVPSWSTPDPLAEKYYSISPYAYCANNPIKFIDPNGKYILGNDNKPVLVNYMNTYSAAWCSNVLSSNATKDQQTIASSAAKTPEGFTQLIGAVDDKEVNTILDLNHTDTPTNEDGNRFLGEFNSHIETDHVTGEILINKQTLTMYEKNIIYVCGAESGNNRYKGIDPNDALGAVFGHERGHGSKEGLRAGIIIKKVLLPQKSLQMRLKKKYWSK